MTNHHISLAWRFQFAPMLLEVLKFPPRPNGFTEQNTSTILSRTTAKQDGWHRPISAISSKLPSHPLLIIRGVHRCEAMTRSTKPIRQSNEGMNFGLQYAHFDFWISLHIPKQWRIHHWTYPRRPLSSSCPRISRPRNYIKPKNRFNSHKETWHMMTRKPRSSLASEASYVKFPCDW